jgi:hypothetical protein
MEHRHCRCRRWSIATADGRGGCTAGSPSRTSAAGLPKRWGRLQRRCNSIRVRTRIGRTRRTPRTRPRPQPRRPQITRPARRCRRAGQMHEPRWECLGAESNHRHGDFQAWSGRGLSRGILQIRTGGQRRCSAFVTLAVARGALADVVTGRANAGGGEVSCDRSAGARTCCGSPRTAAEWSRPAHGRDHKTSSPEPFGFAPMTLRLE